MKVSALRAVAWSALIGTAVSCGTAPPPPPFPRGSWVTRGLVDGKPIESVLRDIEAGRVTLPDLKARMGRDPQLALALATEKSFIKLWTRRQHGVAVYLAREWVSLSGAGLSAVISNPGSMNERSTFLVVSSLTAECPRNCRLAPRTADLVERDWVQMARWVAARQRARDIWDVEDESTGETLMNRARSPEMRQLLASQGVVARSREELEAYAALRRERQAQLEADEREYRRELAERRRREEEEQEAERREQRRRDEESRVEGEASRRAQQESWRRINDKLDNLVSETRATNEEIVRNARAAHAQAEVQRDEQRRRREAEAEASAAREREARRRAVEAAEERERLARAERDERARRRWEAAIAATKTPPVVIDAPFPGPAVAVSESAAPGRPTATAQPLAGRAPGAPRSTDGAPATQPSGAQPTATQSPAAPSPTSPPAGAERPSPSAPPVPTRSPDTAPTTTRAGGKEKPPADSGSGSAPRTQSPVVEMTDRDRDPPSQATSQSGTAAPRTSDPGPKPLESDPCGLLKCTAPCHALIDNCDPIKPSCFPFRRYNECMARCSAEKACVAKRDEEARERLRQKTHKSKSK